MSHVTKLFEISTNRRVTHRHLGRYMFSKFYRRAFAGFISGIALAYFPACLAATTDPNWTYAPAYRSPPSASSEFSIVDDKGTKRTLYSKSYAVLIVQGKYAPGNGFQAVPAAAAKAEQLLKTRLERRGFRVLVWRDLSSRQFKTVLEEVFSGYGFEPNARLFFYYFGHGYIIADDDNPLHERAFLVPIDAPNPTVDEIEFQRAAFPITQMIQYANQGALNHTFFAFEACKAGAIMSAMQILGAQSPPNPKGYLLNPGVLSVVHQFLTAGNNVQDVPADNSFTALIAGALEDPAADVNQDGYITGKEMMNYVVLKLPQWRPAEYPQNPESASRPTPSTGDFIFGPLDPSTPQPQHTVSGGDGTGPTLGATHLSTIDPKAARLEEAEKRHRAAIDILGNKSNSTLLLVDAIGSLGEIAKEVPEMSQKIANELALTALSFSSPHRGDPLTRSLVGEISPETEAALKEIGGLQIMAAGRPLQLQLGNFRGAKLPESMFNGVDMTGADFVGSDLYRSRLYNANLPYSNFSGTNLAGALLSHAAFQGALLCEDHNTAVPALSRIEAVPVQLSGAKLDDANFDGAWLVGAQLGNDKNADDKDRTNMRGAHFTNANLQRADLTYALLDDADFRGANLTGANLTGASAVNVKVDANTRFCGTIWTDGKIRSDSCGLKQPAFRDKHTECFKGRTWRDAR